MISYVLIDKIPKYDHKTLWLVFKNPKYSHKTLWLVFKIPKVIKRCDWFLKFLNIVIRRSDWSSFYGDSLIAGLLQDSLQVSLQVLFMYFIQFFTDLNKTNTSSWKKQLMSNIISNKFTVHSKCARKLTTSQIVHV